MIISFFEEFFDSNSTALVKRITWPARLFVAAGSLEEFEKIEKKVLALRNKNILEVVYWPVLLRKEGYWISAFSDHTALKRVLGELEESKMAVMLDLELPTTRNPWLYLTQLLWFFSNKRRISRFVGGYRGLLYLCEYYPEGRWQEKVLKFLGIHYNSDRAKVIKMLYHSLHPFNEDFVRCELERGKKEWGSRFVIGLGTIAKGVQGTEKILTSEQLERDMNLAREAGVEEVIVFRLAGLTPEIANVCRKYST